MLTGLSIVRATGNLREQAIAQESSVYSADHGCIPIPEPSAHYFAAITESGSLIASYRILGPEARPFEFEDACPLRFISDQRRVALIGRLCVHPEFRAISTQAALHPMLMRIAYRFSRESGYTDLVQFCFPKLKTFYKRAFFEPTGQSFFHRDYGQLMDVLHLDLLAIDALLQDRDERAEQLFGKL